MNTPVARPAVMRSLRMESGKDYILSSTFAPRSGAPNLARFSQNAPREAMISRDEVDRKRISARASLSEEKPNELLSLCGQNLAALRSASITREFRPVDLHASVSMQVKNELRKVDSPNVVALLKGSDPGLRNEYLIYTGHWGARRQGGRPHLSRRE